MPAQLSLLPIAPGAVRCPRCDGAIRSASASCRPCDRDTPQPGGEAWRRWTGGIAAVVRRRLAACDVSAIDVLAVVLYDEARELPASVRATVSDLMALPCSRARYERHERRACLYSSTRDRLVSEGWSVVDATARASAVADEVLAESDAAEREGRRPEWETR